LVVATKCQLPQVLLGCPMGLVVALVLSNPTIHLEHGRNKDKMGKGGI
jgi:hypothetical protein